MQASLSLPGLAAEGNFREEAATLYRQASDEWQLLCKASCSRSHVLCADKYFEVMSSIVRKADACSTVVLAPEWRQRWDAQYYRPADFNEAHELHGYPKPWPGKGRQSSMLHLLSMCAAECRSDNQNTKLLIWPHASFLNGSAAANSPGVYSFSVIDSLIAQAQSAFPRLASVTMVGHSAGAQSLQVGGSCTMHLASFQPLKPNASAHHLSGFLGDYGEPSHHQLAACLTATPLH